MKSICVYWILACLLGNFVQLSWISRKYFRYDVKTVVKVFTPDRIDSPSVVVCTDTRQLFKWDSMSTQLKRKLLGGNGCPLLSNPNRTTIFPNVTDGVDPKYLDEATIIRELNWGFSNTSNCLIRNIQKAFNDTKHPMEEILENTVDREDFIYFQPFDPEGQLNLSWNGSTQNLRDINETMLIAEKFTVIPKRRTCFNLKPQGRYGYNIDYTRVRTSEMGRLSWTCLGYGAMNPPRRMSSMLHIYLCPAGRKSCDWDLMPKVFTMWVHPKYGRRFIHLTYSEYRTTSLPAPYVTNCRNYEEGGTRESCILSCIKDSNGTFSKGHDVTNYCLNKCQEKDCSNTVIIPKVTDQISVDCGKQGFSITLMPPEAPVIASETMESVTLTEFLIDMGFSVGFWVILCLLGITGKVVESVAKLIRRKDSSNMSLGVHKSLSIPTLTSLVGGDPNAVKAIQDQMMSVDKLNSDTLHNGNNNNNHHKYAPDPKFHNI